MHEKDKYHYTDLLWYANERKVFLTDKLRGYSMSNPLSLEHTCARCGKAKQSKEWYRNGTEYMCTQCVTELVARLDELEKLIHKFNGGIIE